MSVVGIDLGNQSCYIACARTGGIETIVNEFSDRCTPSVVTFGERQRFAGQAAKNQMITHMKDTIFNFKRLLGRKFSDIVVESEKERVPFEICAGNNDDTLIEVSYMGKVETFTPQQVCASMLVKLKETAEKAMGTKVVDCVISVPCYYTDAQRRALLDSANVAGLNALRVMNDSCSAALAYGIYKQDLPTDEKKPRYVAFVDMGESNLQVSICAFSQGKLKVICCASDPNLGGRDFDVSLLHHFGQIFKKKYNLDVFSKQRAVRRLLQESEKVRKLMSASSVNIPINVECFMNDIDVTANIKRDTFEELIAPLLDRVEATMHKALKDCGLKPSQIEFVELIGGCTRTPAVKALVEKVFSKPPSTTLNADEAVARGCALQCAILSPTFKVREFSIADCQPYSISLAWAIPDGEREVVEVYEKFHTFPTSRQLSFYRKEPFEFDSFYTSMEGVPFPEQHIGNFKIKGVVPQPDGEMSKVRVKVKLNINGIFTISSASRAEKVEKEDSPEPEKMEVEPAAATEDKASDTPKEETPVTNGPAEAEPKEASPDEAKEPETAEPEKKDEKKKSPKKIKIRYIDLPLQVTVQKLDRNTLNNYIDRECRMQLNDKAEIDKQNAKNAVEEYVYDMRDKLFGKFEKFIEEGERSKFSKVLDEVEEWLYGDGEDETKDVYVKKLSALKNTGDPVATRYHESYSRPDAFQKFQTSLQRVLLAVDMYHKGEEKYSHLEKDDIVKVEACAKEKLEWIAHKMSEQQKQADYLMPAVYSSQILQERTSLESTCNPILTKPKPKPPSPPKEEPPPDDAANKEGDQPEEKNEEVESKPEDVDNPASGEDKPEINPMDVD